MESNLIDRTLETGGTRHKYQYLMLLLTLMIWINIALFSISFPFLQKQPEVNYIDPNTGKNHTAQLNFTICEWKYTPVKVYGHSWVSEFGLECSKIGISTMGTILFLASSLGN